METGLVRGEGRTAVESALVERETELFNLDRTVFFYDLTSTYFEGLAKKNPKAGRGHSRDKRPDCPQVVVALVVNRDGLQEGQTIVLDRGMACAENIATLEGHPKGLHYIVAARQSERAFHDMKSPLMPRPIHHQKIERRVDTHIFLCLLAYHLLVAIEKTLLDQDVHTSWKTLRDKLKTHQVCTVVLPTDTGEVPRIRKGSTPEREHRTIYQLLDVPEQIISTRKTWGQHTQPAKT